MASDSSDTEEGDQLPRQRVVVKFDDDLQVPYVDDVETELVKRGVGTVDQLREEFLGIEFERLFRSLDPDEIRELIEEATRCDPDYKPPNLLTYFAIDCPGNVDPDAVQEAVAEWWGVEIAYVEGGPTRPPSVSPGDDPRSPDQGYLDPAPDGIDAEFAWGVPGGDGDGVGFVDIEQGWTLNHEDLRAASVSLLSGVNKAYEGHGTAVLGEVTAVDNARGCVGITPNLGSADVVSQYRTSSTYNTADAILSAVDHLSFGDVLLLEAQTTVSGKGYMPVEVEDAVFDVIRLGTALGVVVVEAAGNGGNDLDAYTKSGDSILDRESSDFRDSGAIMVGAGSSTTPHSRLSRSNYGSRIDCYGWGENVNTTGDGWTGTGTATYTTSFGGTSSASPIVAGAALATQGMAEARTGGFRYNPRQLRTILSDPANGTPSADPSTDRIGVMPDLRTVANTVLGATPDVYLRDFVGDTGDPHSGSISASPDVIVRPTAVANPQGAFGQGSGTENDATLGFEAEAGQDNYVYVRTRNRGVTASDVTVTVYWSPVSTLVTPDLWSLVGSATIPSVPGGDVLTVSDAITWSAGDVPGTGHYCFVGLVGVDDDPAPDRADFRDWDDFRRFIRSNNNVTWRNFNVVNNTPPPGSEYIALPFIAPGAPEVARPMQLEVEARLPDGARAHLESPQHFLDRLGACQPHEEQLDGVDDALDDGVYLPLNPQGQWRFDEVPFPARSRTEHRLLVHIPEERRDETHDVIVRQLYEGEAVGRVTWRLTPEEREPGENREGRKPVHVVEGIGEQFSGYLRSAGVRTIDELATADPDDVADELRISEDRARRFVEMARLIGLGAHNQTAEVLVTAGVLADDLPREDPDELLERIEETVGAGEVMVPEHYEPDSEELAALVDRA